MYESDHPGPRTSVDISLSEGVKKRFSLTITLHNLLYSTPSITGIMHSKRWPTCCLKFQPPPAHEGQSIRTRPFQDGDISPTQPRPLSVALPLNIRPIVTAHHYQCWSESIVVFSFFAAAEGQCNGHLDSSIFF